MGMCRHPDQSILVFKGRGDCPLLMHMLRGLPIEYFLEPSLRDILMPTLISGIYENETNCSVMAERLSVQYLIDYVDDFGIPRDEAAGWLLASAFSF